MNEWGLIYWSVGHYRWVMKGLRSRGEREEMLARVALAVGDGSVLDLCCGPGDLRGWLPSSPYFGIDLNPAFIQYLHDLQIPCAEGEVLSMSWPAADGVVMVDSLYHFLPRIEAFVSRLRAFSCRRVVISEPVDNVMTRAPVWLRPVGSWLTRVAGEHFPERFTEQSLRDLLQPLGFQTFTRVGHNVIAVWERHG